MRYRGLEDNAPGPITPTNARICDWYDAVDCPAPIRQVLDAALRYHEIRFDCEYQCRHDTLLAALVLSLQENYAPNDSQSLWKWLEELAPELTKRISSRNV